MDSTDNNFEALKKENQLLTEQVSNLKKRLAMSSSAFLNIVGKSLDGIVIIDRERMVVYTNYAAIELFDRNIADLLGEPLDLNLDFDEIFKNKETITELKIPKSDGAIAITEVSVLKTEWNNETCFVVSFRDITERKKTEEILEYMSHHDYLTDLPNRVYFEKHIRKSLEVAKETEQHMAILYIDLDNFKMINDSLGHDVGDLLLKEVSTILRNNIRKIDTVARLGGDEFAIVLNNLRKPQYAGRVAKNILDELSKVFELEGREVFTNASIGIATYPFSGKDTVTLIKNADTAMYSAKQHGKNQFRYFSEELNKSNQINMKIINGLRNVVHNEELFLEYQPIIDIKENKPLGVEVLLRWQHPELGLVPPDSFLPFAEESGSISTIGQWVIKKALSCYKDINNNLNLFINISANELDGANIAEMILNAIQQTEISTENIVLELTETSVMRNPESSIEKFKNLSNIGVQIAIDDFGTGYSSLSYLKKLPLSILKIDRSFTDDIGKDPNDTIIVKSTIQLAHNLGLKVIAEGVETKKQLEFLKENDCDYVQGYYFSKPIKLESLKELLSQYF